MFATLYSVVDSITKNRFLEFLRSNKIAVISTVSSTYQPWSATIYFTVDDDLNFYFMSKKGRKTQNIASNKEVSLVIGTENIAITAQIQGQAERIINNDEYSEIRKKMVELLSQNSFIPPIFRFNEADIHIYKVKPSFIQWLDLREKETNVNFIRILP